ncbi:MAG TPA: ATP-NAD kinase family protein [Candidatus Poseidoniales archaeon]|nr:ATP-NAD kinase family protein [Candidatus Poseidoniales archaeon]
MRVAVLVNPDAGLGGVLAYKGSDGLADEARKAGAAERSGPRTQRTFARFSEIIQRSPSMEVEWMVGARRMGQNWWPSEIIVERVLGAGQTSEVTTSEDTVNMVIEALDAGVDLIVYAGGDGTTRDIVTALAKRPEGPDTPILGIPCGVKMYSGTFASSPEAVAEVIAAFVQGLLGPSTTEVMDLDEEAYREGNWLIRLFSEACTPSSPRWIQGSKQMVEALAEDEILLGMADWFSEQMTKHSERVWLWGSGGTLYKIAEHLGIETTLLGIDAISSSSLLATDLDGAAIEAFADETQDIHAVLSPMGGQGFLIGRANLQLTPRALQSIGPNRILAVATPAKLASLDSLRIETSSLEVDSLFAEAKFIRTLVGYNVQRMLRLLIDVEHS